MLCFLVVDILKVCIVNRFSSTRWNTNVVSLIVMMSECLIDTHHSCKPSHLCMLTKWQLVVHIMMLLPPYDQPCNDYVQNSSVPHLSSLIKMSVQRLAIIKCIYYLANLSGNINFYEQLNSSYLIKFIQKLHVSVARFLLCR